MYVFAPKKIKYYQIFLMPSRILKCIKFISKFHIVSWKSFTRVPSFIVQNFFFWVLILHSISYADLMSTVHMQTMCMVDKTAPQYDLMQHQQFNLNAQVYIDKTDQQLNIN